MGIHARWEIHDPENLPTNGELVAETPEDVDRLVALLTEPSAEPASVEHLARTRIRSEWSGEIVPDHLMWALVQRGYGYLLYYSAEHEHCTAVGDAASRAYHYDYNDFPAGSGISIELFARAIKEFLATAVRPTCVTWRKTL
ncbi:Imm1 family immunity protein [Actinokineospora enzanensis]|uniref:Imm1 family immunity protein n=1 Tax=Actinokineospora enzanensis TaxID=155975 RepID=UPI0003694774|nr:Imm1 family immunity protein [Actinokineospora enzanensis]